MAIGRPRADINWDEVGELLEAGCSGREIAGYLGLEPHTIYDRCLQDNKMPFSTYSSQFYAKGEMILRAHQYAKALGKTKEGDNTLLIWLGKNRLKQKDMSDEELQTKLDKELEKKKAEIDHAAKVAKENNLQAPQDVVDRFDKFIDGISQLQSERKIADKINKVDNKS
jgi:hypothetical protein